MIRPEARCMIISPANTPGILKTLTLTEKERYGFKSEQLSPIRHPRTQPRNVTYAWSSLHAIWFSWITKDLIHISWTPAVEWTSLETPKLSSLERMAATLLALERISEDYVVDLFTQVAIFDENQGRFEAKYKGKHLAVCGGNVFVDDSFEKAVARAQSEFPGRPYYAVSLSASPATM
jgi:hypothetical protein